MVKEVQNHKKSTTNGLHGETSTSVSNKNIQVMSPSEMKNSVSRITRLFFNYFYTKLSLMSATFQNILQSLCTSLMSSSSSSRAKTWCRKK